jgi:SAM-dependent methyltransferase
MPRDADYLHDDLFAAEERHFWFQARNRLIVSAFKSQFASARSFLDVGCGRGAVLAAVDRAIPDLKLVACDALLPALTFVTRRVPRAAVVQLDISQLPYDREFDVTGAFDVLEHLDDDEAVLRQMHRATKVDGGVIITVPQHPFLWSAVDEFSHHRRRYTRTGLLEKVRRAGFHVEQVTSFMTLVLPLLAWSRLRQRGSASLDPAAELTIGSVPNAILKGLCRLEAAAIGVGCSLPVGGSLLVAARRTA